MEMVPDMNVIQTAAQTLSTLCRPTAGVINSWPYYSRSKTTVIIDNMFYAAQNGGASNPTVQHGRESCFKNDAK